MQRHGKAHQLHVHFVSVLLIPCLVSFMASEAVKTCADCAKPQMCLAETPMVQLNGSDQQVTLQVCNYDANAFKNSFKSVKFSLQTVPTCDTTQQTVPLFSEFNLPSGDTTECAAAATGCAVQATLSKPIDWAAALKSATGEGNVLSATLVGTSPADTPAVVVGVLANGIGGLVHEAKVPISVCSMQIPINGSYFSFVKECNKVNLCRGPAGSTTCPTPVDPSAFIDQVVCEKDTCTGTVVFAKRLACDALTKPATSLIGQVLVANSQYSAFATLGEIAVPASTVNQFSGVKAGSRGISLDLDAVCDSADVKVALSTSANQPVATTTLSANGSVLTAALATPLTDAMLQKPLQLQVTQCGQQSAVYALDALDSDKIKNSLMLGASRANGGGSGVNASSDNTSVQAMKESSPWAGLKSGMIAGIAIGVVALVGFVVEFVYHKRHYAPPRMTNLQHRSAATPPTAGESYRA